MIALRFYVSGSFLQVIGNTLGLEKGTVSGVIIAVSDALCRRLSEFVQWPNIEQTRSEFFEGFGFPNVLGAVDGMHIRIQAPHEDESSYVYRKMFHSKVVTLN